MVTQNYIRELLRYYKKTGFSPRDNFSGEKFIN